MTVAPGVLAGVPPGLAAPLLFEYRQIVQNYLEHRWSPAELSGGKFCEITFTILDGHAKGSYPSGPSKPSNFISACRALENNSHVPRSFQILIPRLLPALYEIRNNRGVGHVGGDVDPNHMDATAVLSMTSWVLAELVRVFHRLSPTEAQKAVDSIAEKRTPLIWGEGDIRRVLDVELPPKHQILLLVATAPAHVQVADLLRWTECKDKAYFMRLLRQLHQRRLVELDKAGSIVIVLPPGAKVVEDLVARRQAA